MRSAIFVNTNDLQIGGSGTRGGVAYDGTIFRARTGLSNLDTRLVMAVQQDLNYPLFDTELQFLEPQKLKN